MSLAGSETSLGDLLPERTINTRSSIRMVESTPQDKEMYLSHLQNLLSVVEKEAGGKDGWWVIGGIAREAYLQKDNLSVMEPEGGWRDVDILFSQSKWAVGDKIRRENPTPLEVDIVYRNLAQVGENKAILKFAKVQVEVPQGVFDTKIVNLGGVEFPTLSPETLFHIYCIGGGPKGTMREKDFLNAMDLGRYIRQHPDPKYPETLYRGFHEFTSLKKASSEGLTSLLVSITRKYRTSKLNKVLPIDSPRMLPVLEHVWQACGGINVRPAEEKAPIPAPALLSREPQVAG